MKVKIIEDAKTIMSNNNSKHNYFAWPTVVKMNNNTIIAGASGFRHEHVCPFGKACIAYSADNGNTYTKAVPIIDTVLDDRDVGLCKFDNSGLIVTSFNNTRKMQRMHNADNEKAIKDYIASYLDTVTDEEENKYIGSLFTVSRDNGISFGEIHKSPVTSPHGPIQLSDGRILWVGSNYYNENNSEEFYEFISAYTLDPDNGKLEFVGKIPDIIENGNLLNSCEPYAIELDNGRLICHIRTEQNFTTYQSVSDDYGKTWSVPEKLLSDFGGAPCHILRHSSGVLISLYGYRQKPYEIRAMISEDNGDSWETDITIYVNNVSDDIGYPATVELDDGTLLTVFYAKKSDNSPCNIMQIKWIIEK